jgi:hypothetical protein
VVVLAALLIAACSPSTTARIARTSLPAGTATSSLHPIPTPTLAPAGPLAWQAHPSPISLIPSPSNAAPPPRLTVAASDGNTAYLCVPQAEATATGPQVWVTHDRAAHWTRVAEPATGNAAESCTVVVDDLDPARAVVWSAPGGIPGAPQAPGGTLFPFYATEDAGHTWRPVRGPLGELAQIATYAGVSYALFRGHPQSASQIPSRLAISRDNWRTWTAIDQQLAPVIRFWLNPFAGSLLARTVSDTIFWQTAISGQPWIALSSAPFAFGPDGVVVQTPFAGQPWQICGTNPSTTYPTGAPNPHTEDIACSMDGGATWSMQRIPSLATLGLIAIADDGTLLLESRLGHSGASITLYRLAPGHAALDPLGPVPPSMPASYSAGGGTGVLWGLPADAVGNLVIDAQGRIFTASYPS